MPGGNVSRNPVAKSLFESFIFLVLSNFILSDHRKFVQFILYCGVYVKVSRCGTLCQSSVICAPDIVTLMYSCKWITKPVARTLVSSCNKQAMLQPCFSAYWNPSFSGAFHCCLPCFIMPLHFSLGDWGQLTISHSQPIEVCLLCLALWLSICKLCGGLQDDSSAHAAFGTHTWPEEIL